MNTGTFGHPLDTATRLAPAGDGSMLGHTTPDYANMVGPFGGVIAATMLNAVLVHAQRLGDPVALTVNYAAPVANGEFHANAVATRTNRSTQHWNITLTQGGEIVATATAMFAIRRETWTSTEKGFPQVPPPSAVERSPALAFAAWTSNYELRFIRGPLPDFSNPPERPDSETMLWVRDHPPRPLDFLALAAICDVFYPRIIVRRPRRVPAGTVSITTYFHADTALLAAQGEQPVLGCARASHFGRGFHDQSAEIWSPDGALLATSHQIVYYKE